MAIKEKIVRYSPPQFIDWGKALVSPDFRREYGYIRQLRGYPRYTPGSTNILGPQLDFVDSASLISMYREIFRNRIYGFQASKDDPYVIDCGSNIGLSIIYFKKLYPRSRILAFEADKTIFEVLRGNLSRFGYENIDLHCKAVWSSETTLNFYAEGADGGRLSNSTDRQDVTVPTVRLRDFLDRDIDMLKMDIEGAESEVILDCADSLGQVRNLFIEYHSFENERQTLHSLLNAIDRAGFRIHIHTVANSPQPFIERHIDGGMDMQLNIFAFRN
jgi:FkbM family methyltransferase